ncbi:Phosphoenolpyruvate/pyruvate domain-containing protein [Cylindrobasidium torrendii FP15055 ss-10]|uniref:Phosphoenolpyruvate/pyruvate domain-containing protein n=1 Tax=Cylindrobasidium torrendii FP15055 ss-10 TaxID=1314674 RepID=A0A0D7AX31_9AGAR|nr:Phosphoenolpyruvate/pyruvate domain-containing protein [Cylindrobasidium torrendii FP15055 ss-10]
MSYTAEEYAAASAICRRNALKDKMDAGGIGYSFGLQTTLNPEIALMAKIAGYDALLLNLEHSKTGLETFNAIACAALAENVAPIVVVPSLQSDWISRSLDVGAQGIIVPRVGTAAQAAELVKYAKYRPHGERPLADTPAQRYQLMGMNFVANMTVTNERVLAIPMIETVEGLENVEAIAATPGVDMLFVGTFDLTDDMGIAGQYDDPRLAAAYERICKAAEAQWTETRKVYVGCGGIEWRPDMMRDLSLKYKSIRYFMAGRDSTVLLNGMKAQAGAMAELDAQVLAARK